MNPLYIIPSYDNIEKSLELAKRYQALFEYNDFYKPYLLDNADMLREMIRFYTSLERDRKDDTLHAAFLDIALHSQDSKIRDVSEHRVRQCMDITAQLGIRGIILHTNYIANFHAAAYQETWLEKNEEFIRRISREYPGIQIYMENMFDVSPGFLTKLAERLEDVKSFGVCFDIAHANLSQVPLEQWHQALSPYIRHIHINDNKGVVDSHDMPGTGNIDWNLVKKLMGNRPVSVLLEITDVQAQEQALIHMKEEGIFPF